jgi:hypothetical protein
MVAEGRGFRPGESAVAGRALPKELGVEARGERHREGHENPNAKPKQAATLAAPEFLAGADFPESGRLRGQATTPTAVVEPRAPPRNP